MHSSSSDKHIDPYFADFFIPGFRGGPRGGGRGGGRGGYNRDGDRGYGGGSGGGGYDQGKPNRFTFLTSLVAYPNWFDCFTIHGSWAEIGGKSDFLEVGPARFLFFSPIAKYLKFSPNRMTGRYAFEALMYRTLTEPESGLYYVRICYQYVIFFFIRWCDAYHFTTIKI